MDSIVLSGKKELDIYINPQRQRLLRTLALAAEPMTPKQLSVVLGISPSAVQHHIQKLVALGVIAESHTEQIRGITAHYYHALPVTVRIGCDPSDEYADQRLALMQNGVNEVFQGFAAYLGQSGASRRADSAPALQADPSAEPVGDVLWGIVRLQKAEANALMALIRDFLCAHDRPASGSDPWEYALIAYPVGEAEPRA